MPFSDCFTPRFRGTLVVSAMLIFMAIGCEPRETKPALDGSKPGTSPSTTGTTTKGKVAKATIEGRSGSKLSGEATFTETDGIVKVEVHVMNAPPGKHAVHVHEKGDCSAPDASSAGGHFNPGGHNHGAPDAKEHHAGDFGNMDVGADGHGKLELTSKDITVKEGPTSVVGRGIIVHEKEDDMTTQPTGAAGGRIGCGVIQAQ